MMYERPDACKHCGFPEEAHEIAADHMQPKFQSLQCPQWFQTFSGVRFYPTAPRVDDVRIEDIAHALAHTCRFAGHTLQHYSVAQHSVIVSHLVPATLAFAGLLHDAAEAYIVDLPRPLKHSPLLKGYRTIEARVERVIYQRFNITLHEPLDSNLIKKADRIALATERRDVLPQHGHQWASVEAVEPDKAHITPWSQQLAREQFMARFHELTRLHTSEHGAP